MTLSLFGFNLGIEAVQLLVVAVLLPPLVIIARRTPAAYRFVRIGRALVAGTAAVGWLLDRLGRSNPIATLADSLGGHGWILVLAAWTSTATAVLASRTKPRLLTTDRPSDQELLTALTTSD